MAKKTMKVLELDFMNMSDAEIIKQVLDIAHSERERLKKQHNHYIKKYTITHFSMDKNIEIKETISHDNLSLALKRLEFLRTNKHPIKWDFTLMLETRDSETDALIMLEVMN